MFDDGITLHDKHSYRDFGAWLKSKTIGIQSTIKITETIPYMQGSYDFTELYGEQTYDDRELEYEFDLHATTDNPKKELRAKAIAFTNWLKSASKSELIDDDYPGFYFLAEAVDNIDIDDTEIYIATIKVKFTAYGLMIKNDLEGQTRWDTFGFLTDTLQQTKFEINGAREIFLYNVGIRSITPQIICDSDFILNIDDYQYKLTSGITKDYRLSLKKGVNRIIVTGTGNIEFKFRFEVL